MEQSIIIITENQDKHNKDFRYTKNTCGKRHAGVFLRIISPGYSGSFSGSVNSAALFILDIITSALAAFTLASSAPGIA